MLHGEVDEALQRFWTDTRERHRFLQHDRGPPDPAARGDLFLRAEEFFTRAQRARACWRCGATKPVDWARPLPDLSVERGAPRAARRACSSTSTATPHRVLLVAESDRPPREPARPAARQQDRAAVGRRPGRVRGSERRAVRASPSRRWRQGLRFELDRATPASSSSPRPSSSPTTPTTRRRRKQEQVSDVNALIKDLSELKVGDPVVHTNHGIGRYLGLMQHRPAATAPASSCTSEYADKATLYVPVAQLHLISRYTGVSAEEAPLHKLGSGQWDKAKPQGRRAGARHRRRAAQPLRPPRRARGHAFRFSPHDYEAFAASFGFEETPDQKAAIHAVIQDMISPQADGPPGVRRRRLRQDRGGAARRVRRGQRRQAGRASSRPPRCWPSSTSRPSPTASASGRSRWPSCRRFRSAKEIKVALEGIGRRHDRHRRRHAQAASARA